MHTYRRSPSDFLTVLLISSVAVALTAQCLANLLARRDADACLENLRRIGTAAMMYENDFDGMLVPYAVTGASGSFRYTKLLYAYLGDHHVFSCPADRLDEDGKLLTSAPYPSTYGVNWYISQMAGTYGGTPVPGRHRAFVRDPARTIWAADTAAIDIATAKMPAAQWREDFKRAQTADIYYFYLPQDPMTGTGYTWNDPNWSGMIIRPFPRHAGRVNVCFYDGHAGSVPARQFDPMVTHWKDPGCLWDNPPD